MIHTIGDVREMLDSRFALIVAVSKEHCSM